jgi:hypothetical protein
MSSYTDSLFGSNNSTGLSQSDGIPKGKGIPPPPGTDMATWLQALGQISMQQQKQAALFPSTNGPRSGQTESPRNIKTPSSVAEVEAGHPQLSSTAVIASQGPNATNQWAMTGGVPGVDPTELSHLNAVRNQVGANRIAGQQPAAPTGAMPGSVWAGGQETQPGMSPTEKGFTEMEHAPQAPAIPGAIPGSIGSTPWPMPVIGGVKPPAPSAFGMLPGPQVQPRGSRGSGGFTPPPGF